MNPTHHFYLSDKAVVNMLIIASVITAFLFFIDERAFNFNWMLNFGNWILFVIYVLVLTFIQLLIWFTQRIFSKVFSIAKKDH
ncbi:MAG: hypothetical protein K1X81_02985 [Bacteroidia bacterium]|nr:hypothetical protein [Bacteroidia bacterium]